MPFQGSLERIEIRNWSFIVRDSEKTIKGNASKFVKAGRKKLKTFLVIFKSIEIIMKTTLIIDIQTSALKVILRNSTILPENPHDCFVRRSDQQCRLELARRSFKKNPGGTGTRHNSECLSSYLNITFPFGQKKINRSLVKVRRRLAERPMTFLVIANPRDNRGRSESKSRLHKIGKKRWPSAHSPFPYWTVWPETSPTINFE